MQDINLLSTERLRSEMWSEVGPAWAGTSIGLIAIITSLIFMVLLGPRAIGLLMFIVGVGTIYATSRRWWVIKNELHRRNMISENEQPN